MSAWDLGGSPSGKLQVEMTSRVPDVFRETFWPKKGKGKGTIGFSRNKNEQQYQTPEKR